MSTDFELLCKKVRVTYPSYEPSYDDNNLVLFKNNKDFCAPVVIAHKLTYKVYVVKDFHGFDVGIGYYICSNLDKGPGYVLYNYKFEPVLEKMFDYLWNIRIDKGDNGVLTCLGSCCDEASTYILNSDGNIHKALQPKSVKAISEFIFLQSKDNMLNIFTKDCDLCFEGYIKNITLITVFKYMMFNSKLRLWGLISLDYPRVKIILDFKYDSIRLITINQAMHKTLSNLLIVCEKGMYGLCDLKGNFIFECKFKSIELKDVGYDTYELILIGIDGTVKILRKL